MSVETRIAGKKLAVDHLQIVAEVLGVSDSVEVTKATSQGKTVFSATAPTDVFNGIELLNREASLREKLWGAVSPKSFANTARRLLVNSGK